jgi:RNA polymerase sigma-70 factor, ECF subfamily
LARNPAAMTSFEELYQRYARDVHRFALYLSRDPADAEDITSQTFVRALLARNEIRETTVKAYLFTIARNIYRNERRRAAREAVDGTALAEAALDRAQTPECRVDLDRRFRTVAQAIDALSGPDRTALLLRADEMPYVDIARILGTSVAAARVRVHRARLRLAELCGEGGDDER